jgi:hypothetical protein
MPLPAVTRVSNLQVNPSSTNKNNGFYAPQLTTVKITTIPANTKVNGGIFYNTDTNTFQNITNSALATFNSTTNLNGYTAIAFGAGTPTATAPFNAQTHTVGTLYFDTAVPKLWVCSVAGTPGTFVGVVVA